MELMKTLLRHISDDIDERAEMHRRKSFYQSVQKDELDLAVIGALQGIAKAIEKTIDEHTVPDNQWDGADGLEQA